MTRAPATIASALTLASERIDRYDAVYLLCFVMRAKRAFLAAHGEQPLTAREEMLFETLVASRAMGVPVAYLINRREFYGRDFAVDGRALIPRPETESLITAVLATRAQQGSAPGRILDIGTGSGIIGITLALERPADCVIATDLSAAAIELAQANAARHGLAPPRWQGRTGSLFEPVADQRFDVIVSNPPYIAADDPHLTAGDLRFEPSIALTDGSADGGDCLRAIIAGARDRLVAQGALWLEHGYTQSAMVQAALRAAGFQQVVSLRDLAGIERVTGGTVAVTSQSVSH
jgi:release factor glutamine methyltransferase